MLYGLKQSEIRRPLSCYFGNLYLSVLHYILLNCVFPMLLYAANPQFSPPRQQHQRDKLHCNYFSIQELALQARGMFQKLQGGLMDLIFNYV